MFGSWIIEAAVRFNEGSAVRGLAMVAGGANSASAQMGGLTRRITEQELAMRRYHFAMGVAGLTFVGLAATIGYGVSQAGQMERAMMGVRIATGASAREFEALNRLAVNVSSQTAQSVTTIAQEMATAATSGLNQPKRLAEAFPEIARAADIMQFSPKHIAPVEAVQQMTQLAHLFGSYHGAALHNMVDAAARLMFTQPETLKNAVTQGRFFIPEALASGVTQQDIFTQLLTMGQTGFLRGRGGSGLARFIEYTMSAPMLTAHLSKTRRAGMEALQMFDANGRMRFIDKQGNFELQKAVEHLAAMRAHLSKSAFMSDVFKAFLAQGGRYLMAITRPEVMKQMQLNLAATQRLAPPGKFVEQTQQQYIKGTLLGSMQYALTNLQNVFVNIFRPTLPGITKFFDDLGDTLGRISTFIGEHPIFAKGIAGFMTGIATFAGTIVAVGAVTQALKFLGIVQELPNAFLLTVAPIRSLWGGLLRVAAASTGVDVNLLKTAAGFRALAGAGLATTASGLTAVAGGLTAIGATLGLFMGIIKNLQDAAKNPAIAALLKWGASGANAGQAPPGTEGTVDVFGRPISHYNPSRATLLRGAAGSRFNQQYGSNARANTHIGTVHINLPNVQQPEQAAPAIGDLFSNPLSPLYTSSPGTRTQRFLPNPLAVPPR